MGDKNNTRRQVNTDADIVLLSMALNYLEKAIPCLLDSKDKHIRLGDVSKISTAPYHAAKHKLYDKRWKEVDSLRHQLKKLLSDRVDDEANDINYGITKVK